MISDNYYKLDVIFIKTLFLVIEQDSQCNKWESEKLGEFKCSGPEPTKLTKETIKTWNHGKNCRKKCLEHVSVMGYGCCEAKGLSNPMENPQPTSTITKSTNKLYQTECIFRSGASVERIPKSPPKSSNEDKTLACEGTLK